MKKIIQIEHLKKSFGDIVAVDDISFDVHEGELFAFLGINGAGKSTTINILCGLYPRDGGNVIVDGESIDDSDKYKHVLGVVYQDCCLDKNLSVLDNLVSRAALYGIHGDQFKARLDELDELLNIKPLLKKQLGKLSGGQRRKIDIARAIVHSPKILILDEPTTGLDPQTRQTVWTALSELRRRNNMTILLTTHYMEETTSCDYVIILDSGKIVTEGTPIQLKNKYTGDYIKLYNTSEETIQSLGKAYSAIPQGFKIQVKNTAEATSLILEYPSIFVDYEIEKGNMDDVFLNATGKNLQGEYGND